MKINWRIRFKNKAFWIFMIPTVLLLITQILSIFGITVDFTDTQQKILAVINTIFAILSFLGVANDPTTTGMSDSERALHYHTPSDQ